MKNLIYIALILLLSSCKQVFVWRMDDIFGLIILGVIALILFVLLLVWLKNKIFGFFKRLFVKRKP